MKEEKTPLIELMRRKYPYPEYALMREVSDAAGFHRSRSADFIAVNLYPSRGLSITGFEAKSYRSDWLSELKNPQKAENIFQYCDYFYLLTTENEKNRIVLNPNEIPETWGWINVRGERFYTVKEAPALKPKPLSKHFMAAMLKRTASITKDYVHIDSIQERIDSAVKRAEEDSKERHQRAHNQLAELREEVKAFEKSSGLDFHKVWNKDHQQKLGEAVKFVLAGGLEAQEKKLLKLQEDANSISTYISGLLKKENEKEETKETVHNG